jgi:periplasmic divalent cation tolerance protein
VATRGRSGKGRRSADAPSGGTEAVVILSTAPTKAVADRIAGVLVRERLAACVNVVGGLASFYRWKGKIMKDAEALCIVKTRRHLVAPLSARLTELHPYDVPEVIALPVMGGARPYLQWLLEETRARGRPVEKRRRPGASSRSSGSKRGRKR